MLKRLAIICRMGTWDNMLTSIGFALLASSDASQPCEVNMLMTSWAVELLKKGALNAAPFPAVYQHREAELKEIASKLRFKDLYTGVQMAHATGRYHLYACALASQLFGVTDQNIIPEAEFKGPIAFLREIATSADVVLTLS